MQRHRGLDALRGLAAFAIINYHFAYYTTAFRSNGSVYLVDFFFGLSALTMMMVYGAGFSEVIDRGRLLEFYRHRVARIMPLLVCVAAISTLLAIRSGDAVLGRGILTGTGLFALAAPGAASIGNGAWSIGAEISFYLVFPVLAVVAAPWSGRRLAIIAIALALASAAYLPVIAYAGDDAPYWHVYAVPLSFAPFFAAGLAMWRTSPKRRPLNLIVAAGCGAALFALTWRSRTEFVHDPAAHLVLCLIAVAMLYAAWAAEVPAKLRGAVGALADLSFPLYLTHFYAFVIVRRAALTGVAGWTAFVLLALILALAAHVFVERPARRFLGNRMRVALRPDHAAMDRIAAVDGPVERHFSGPGEQVAAE
jgi:peptidoglycan/LPS O-acetylase OafA/YrhL